jgi:hypothetical protein
MFGSNEKRIMKDKEMGIELNYASKMQAFAEQDIEVKYFDTTDNLIYYLEERFDRDDDKTVYVYLSESSAEYPHASITRVPDDIILYCSYGICNSIYIYECTSYSDALEYLKMYFADSSVFEG